MTELPIQETPSFSFAILARDDRSSARCGRITTSRGTVETPAFMPVGTQATVKTLHPAEVRATGAEIILANTYHLMLRPGVDVIEAAGGVQRFTGWPGPMLTDSGGFQIFSLAAQVKVREEGAAFRSHIDGSHHLLTPERAIQLQLRYRSDIVMQLDHVVGYPADDRLVDMAMLRSGRWLQRCIAEFDRLDGRSNGSHLFGISQGGMNAELRKQSARIVAEADVAGCAIGGLSVGEPKELMNAMLEITTPELPDQRPRYLMGVGSPEDLWNGVARGVDMFDCVLPTRLARNGALFTEEGRVNITNRRYRDHHRAVDDACDCTTCASFTAAYLHHLFRAQEILGMRLASIHNVRFLVRQMERIRRSIGNGTFPSAMTTFLGMYRTVSRQSSREFANA